MKTRVDSARIITANSTDFLKELFNKIDNYEIRTWIYDEAGHLSHLGDQYIDKFYFEYEIEKINTIIAFHLFAEVQHSFAISRAIPLLKSMLSKHFGDSIEII